MNQVYGFVLAVLCALLIVNPAHAKHDKQKSLPPGLQKKAAQGEPLPPGWQKKLIKGEVLDYRVYSHGRRVSMNDYPYLQPDPPGAVTIEVDGRIIRLMESTLEILDIFR
jgi:hypothetical protein